MFKYFLINAILILWPLQANAILYNELKKIQIAYPDYIKGISSESILWYDGTKMLINEKKASKSAKEKLEAPNLADQINDMHYPIGPVTSRQIMQTKSDPGRIRYMPFFQKMYGDTEKTVESHLTTIYWMPKIFGKKYPLKVTRINHVDEKLKHVSSELESLPSSYYQFLKNPAGTFVWRHVANTNYLSPHSFGMSIDLNTQYTNYWQWDLRKAGKPIDEDAEIQYHNQIPWPIVKIFEKNGFIWGGKWYHYDTMHFEYRPELTIQL